MKFADNINRICKERGTKLTPVIIECGFSPSKATAINNGSIPKEADLHTLADHLGCAVSDFFWDGKSTPKERSEDEEEIIFIFRGLTRREQHEFMTYIYRFETDSELKKGKRQNVG